MRALENHVFEYHQHIDIPLTVPNANDICQTLHQIYPSDGKKSLGVFLAPDGSQKEQLKVLY